MCGADNMCILQLKTIKNIPVDQGGWIIHYDKETVGRLSKREMERT